MIKENYTILLWIIACGIVAIMANGTLTSAGSWAAIVAAILALGGIIFAIIRWLKRKRNLREIDICYLIPKNHYPFKDYIGAPEQESYPKSLTVGIGKYTLLLLAQSKKMNVNIDPLVLVFEGNNVNKPKILGKDKPYIVEVLKDGSYRDWWGNITLPPQEYPRYLYRGDNLIDGNRIETIGDWEGNLHVQIRVRETIIHKKLEFIVSKDKDDTPHLHIKKAKPYLEDNSVSNLSHVASTVRVDKQGW